MFKQEIKTIKLTFEIGGVFEVPEKNTSLESDPEFTYESRPVTVTSHFLLSNSYML